MALRGGWVGAGLLALSILTLAGNARADAVDYIIGTDAAGVSQELAVNRYPALYTGDFGDCLGGQSLFNITKFDAAYYADNLTVLFHLDGSTNIKNESLMMHISVSAYGESRFDMTFDPCLLNIYSLCPLNASVPITGWAVIPIGPLQVENIPPIALSIPDIEGFAKIQIFANSTQTEIGCFQAVMKNGNSFSQPAALSSILAVFVVIAIVASFATATYGVSIPHMRTHYAHSLSVLVVFETLQSIFFSGALSVQWPSMLVAWWSNFACFAGMIYTSSLVHSINPFAGVTGNASQVGGAGSSVVDSGGGLAAQIYGRSLKSSWRRAPAAAPRIFRRYNASDPFDYTWAGGPVAPGQPLPGTWSSFAGTLSEVGIPAKDAFTVGLVWFVVALALVASSVLAFKGALELMARRKWIKHDRLAYFRSHYRRYLSQSLLRAVFIGFFMMTTLALLQVTIDGALAPTVLAAFVFVLLVVGVGALVAHACHVRLRLGRHVVEPDSIVLVRKNVLRFIPVIVPTRKSTLAEAESDAKPFYSVSFFRVRFVDHDPSRAAVHRDEPYLRRLGWLSARYRRTRWWFFAFYAAYQLVRACFIGGAADKPTAQVFGIFIVEIVAFVVVVKLSPFEGARNTALAVWMLGISKVATAGVSIAFLPAISLDRIIATVLGVVIIVVQGLMLIALAILIVIGAFSSHMSLTRNREAYRPESLEAMRIRYFEAIEAKAPDVPRPRKKEAKKAEVEAEPEVPKEPYFAVNNVRRAPKIEDEDGDIIGAMDAVPPNSSTMFHPERHHHHRASRPNSISSRYSVGSLPRGARPHRASWSSKDFAQWDAIQLERPGSALAQRLNSANHSARASRDAGYAKGPSSLAPLVTSMEALQGSQVSSSSQPVPSAAPATADAPPVSPLTPIDPAPSNNAAAEASAEKPLEEDAETEAAAL